jgi:hypothetical protein
LLKVFFPQCYIFFAFTVCFLCHHIYNVLSSCHLTIIWASFGSPFKVMGNVHICIERHSPGSGFLWYFSLTKLSIIMIRTHPLRLTLL